jgi:hypothetical protein
LFAPGLKPRIIVLLDIVSASKLNKQNFKTIGKAIDVNDLI